MTSKEGTRSRALKEARALLQSFGLNGFSFQHIADAIGIKKPSLYEHFKTKDALIISIVEEYRAQFETWSETIDIFGPQEKVGALFEVFFKFASNAGRICPLSALIADFHSLPKLVRKPVTKLFALQYKWLQEVIEDGQKKGVFRKDMTSRDLADMIWSIGMGGQLVARVLEEPSKLKDLKRQAFRALAP